MRRFAYKVLVSTVAAYSSLSFGQANNSDAMLACNGRITWEGHNAPKGVDIPKAQDGEQRYLLRGNALVQSGEGNFPDRSLVLCSTTSDSYTFSNDCSAAPMSYVEDWIHEKNFDLQTSPFFKKYKESQFDLTIVKVDRVDLTLVDSDYTNENHSEMRESKYISIPYLVSSRFVAACRVVKPKI